MKKRNIFLISVIVVIIIFLVFLYIFRLKFTKETNLLCTFKGYNITLKTNIELNERGLIITNDSKTSMDNVYAGGDVVTGSATVILAMEAGKKAALKINRHCCLLLG